MAVKIIVNHASPVITAVECKISSYYRRQSDPTKVYLCTRDTSYASGNMLVSLTHGNRVTSVGGRSQRDFIEVDVTIEASDILS